MDTRIDGSILSGKIVLLTGAGGGRRYSGKIPRRCVLPAYGFVGRNGSKENVRRYTCPVRLSGYYIQQRCSRHYRKNRRSEYRRLGLVLCGKPESPGHADILFPRNKGLMSIPIQKQLIRGTEYGEENAADGKRQDSILDIRSGSVWRG